MARSGSFGRLPRTAPDLSGTIVSMIRELQNMQDRNMEIAWKEGGLYEGKKVTDSMFLDHWKSRRDQVSKDDPTWDFYNNMVINYGYSIRESKMSLKYAQNKVSEAQMAAFYRQEASKLPTDSEAYRELMRNAAQFQNAVRARTSGAHGSNAQAKANAFATQRDNILRNGGADAQAWVDDVLLTSARNRGFLLSPDAKGNGGQDFDDLVIRLENDPAQMMTLIEDLGALVASDPNLQKQLKKLDPSWNGTFDFNYVASLYGRGASANITAARLATKGGYKAEANRLNSAASKIAAKAPFVAGLDELEAYSLMRPIFDARLEMANSAAERKVVREWWAGQLKVLISGGTTFTGEKVAGAGGGSPYVGPLTKEWEAVTGQTSGLGLSLMENPTGTGDAKVKDDGDLAQILLGAQADAKSLEARDSGEPFIQGEWEMDPTTKVLTFKPQYGGTQWGTVSDASSTINPALLATADMATIAVRDSDGKMVMAYVPTKKIQVVAQSNADSGSDPLTGEPTRDGFKTTDGMSQTIGKTMVVDGVTMYGVFEKDTGRIKWTTTDIWNKEAVQGVPVVDDNGNTVVTVASSTKLYDPFVAVERPLVDPELTHTQSYYSPLITAFMSTAEKQVQLMGVKYGDMAAIAAEIAKSDPLLAQDTMNEYQKASDTVYHGESYAAQRDALERGLPRMLADERLQKAEFSQNKKVTPDRDILPNGEKRMVDNRALVTEEEAHARARDAISRFNALGGKNNDLFNNKPTPLDAFANQPALKLPKLISDLTGETVNWRAPGPRTAGGGSFAPPAFGPPLPPTFTPPKTATPAASAKPKPAEPKPEPPKPVVVPKPRVRANVDMDDFKEARPTYNPIIL